MEQLMADIAGSRPERVIYHWLEENCRYPWGYQTPLFGGRLYRGGAVVDFYIETPLQPVALRLQSWWHGALEAQEWDRIQRIQLEGEGLHVVVLWSNEFMRTETEVDEVALDDVMYAILAGHR